MFGVLYLYIGVTEYYIFDKFIFIPQDSNTKCPMKSSDMDSGCSLESNGFGLEHSSESTESKPTTLIASSEENSCPAVALTESDSDFYEDESINLASNVIF